MNRPRRPLFLFSVLLFSLLANGPAAIAQESPTEESEPTKEAPYVPTPEHVVRKMLHLADVSSDDVVYDLGSGDGRIVIMAAKEFGARGVEIEIDSQLVERARARARRAGVADKVEFHRGDLFETDLREASVVMLYLWPTMNNRLRPKLQRELNTGDRVVSHSFDIDGWAADSTVSMSSASFATDTKTLFRWTIPDSSATE